MPVNIKSPDFDVLTQSERNAKMAAVKADFEAMENAVMRLSGWRDHMDVPSFLNFMLVKELVRNTELEHPKSTFLWKREGGKWTWGPLWDFDWTFGYQGGQTYWASAASQLYTGRDGNRPGSKFFNKLLQDPGFRRDYKARWNELKPLVSDIAVFVGETGEKLERSDIQNKRVWGSQYTLDYKTQIKSMQTWFDRHITYLDGVINAY